MTVMNAVLWFFAIIALIPVALWLLKRTPMGGGASSSAMRHVATLPLAQHQKVVTVEVGQGDDMRWLVLGVTANSITTLHTMLPQPEAVTADAVPPFAQLLNKLRNQQNSNTSNPGAAGER